MKKLLLACALILALPITATAQISYLNNTGCANAGNTPVGGSHRIGQTLRIASTQLPCNSPGTSGFIFLSLSCNTLPPLSVGCFNNPCVMVIPDVVFSRPISQNISINIPNDRTLAGFTFCAQGGCLSTFGGACIFPLNKAAQIKIEL